VARGDVLDERDATDVEAELLEEREIALAAAPEPEAVAGGDHLDSGGTQHPVGELLRGEAREALLEGTDERIVHPLAREELQAPLERRQQLHLRAEERARVRIERDDGRTES